MTDDDRVGALAGEMDQLMATVRALAAEHADVADRVRKALRDSDLGSDGAAGSAADGDSDEYRHDDDHRHDDHQYDDHQYDDHRHDDSVCRACPICQGLAALRRISPETIEQLAGGLRQIGHALNHLLAVDLAAQSADASSGAAGNHWHTTAAPGPAPEQPVDDDRIADQPTVRIQQIDITTTEPD